MTNFENVDAADLPGSPWGADFFEEVWSYTLWFFESNQLWLAIVLAVFVAAGVVSLILSIFGYRDDDDDDD